MVVDVIRLSNSLTVEHNTLGPGVIGHIMRNRTWDAGTLARTDRWFHYDQVGTVISTTDADGAAIDTNWFDAFGNRQEDWETGLLAPAGGWGLHSKNRDPLAGMHYMSQRWYAADLGVFASTAPVLPFYEHSYSLALQRPSMMIDPDGEHPALAFAGAGGAGGGAGVASAVVGGGGGGAACVGAGPALAFGVGFAAGVGLYSANLPGVRTTGDSLGQAASDVVDGAGEAVSLVEDGLTYIGTCIKEHTSKARPSTEEKHENAEARRKRDRSGEKADPKRNPRRKRPKGPDGKPVPGPWPPKQ